VKKSFLRHRKIGLTVASILIVGLIAGICFLSTPKKAACSDEDCGTDQRTKTFHNVKMYYNECRDTRMTADERTTAETNTLFDFVTLSREECTTWADNLPSPNTSPALCSGNTYPIPGCYCEPNQRISGVCGIPLGNSCTTTYGHPEDAPLNCNDENIPFMQNCIADFLAENPSLNPSNPSDYSQAVFMCMLSCQDFNKYLHSWWGNSDECSWTFCESTRTTTMVYSCEPDCQDQE